MEFAEKELTDEVEADEVETDAPETDAVSEPVADGEEPDAVEADDSDSDEVTVTFGDDAPEADATEETPIIRDMRRKLREAEKDRKALQKQLTERDGPAKDDLREKPTQAAHDYDNDAYESDLIAWVSEKQAHEAKASAVTQEWDTKVQSYVKAKASLRATDYPEAEAAFMAEIDTNRQGMLLDAVERPELVILALGRNPDKLAEIAAITNPVKYAAALARLETQMKVGTRKAPAPERKVKGSAPGGNASQDKLAAIKDAASKSGDFSAYYAAKRAASQ
tara:strand:+ start:4241 stop:5077 length:837 start_codon:yes stop_codon:yes gene_type:complete